MEAAKMPEIYDVAVIGGGPAGYVAAIKAAQLGGRVVLFEKDVVGGTCLNRGCIPTKTLVKTGEILESVRRGEKRGICSAAPLSVDMSRAVDYKNGVVKRLTGGVAGLLKSWDIRVVKGEAEMAGEDAVLCGGEIYRAKSTLLCGGSAPAGLPIPGAGGPRVLTSDEILDLREMPKRLSIIGGGVIGCEIATAFACFGCRVTVVEMAERLLPTMDAELSEVMKKSLEGLGVAVLLSQSVKEIREDATVVLSDGEAAGDSVLLATGRSANLTCLGVLRERIRVEKGKVVVDEHMRTTVPHIYAPGDINGRSMLAHAAFKMGETAAANAMGQNHVCDLDLVPGCVYTLPEVASVGLAEEEALERYGKEAVAVGRFPFAANGRALANGEPEGFVKVIADKRYGELLGVHIAGPSATETIAAAAALMAAEVPVGEAAEMIFAHPTCSEAFMEACADALGMCIHLPQKPPAMIGKST